ncbi:MAG: NAD(P)/FAD-dependent oxidoreductase [Rhodanobacteraceae bacterium]
MARPPITVIGAGLVGSLLAVLLAKRGFDVEVIERRPDPRARGFLGGRSINLALAERGLHALRQAGLADAVLQQAVMMRGRMVHPLDGTTNLQRYGRDDSEVIWSVSRGGLNIQLIDAAERAGAAMHFDHALDGADFARGTITLADAAGGRREHSCGLLLGADGAGSALRAAMAREIDLHERIDLLGHGYKELEIPALNSLPQRGRAGVGADNENSSQGLPPPQPPPLGGGGQKPASGARNQENRPPSPLMHPALASPIRTSLCGRSSARGRAARNPDSPPAGGGNSMFALEPHALHIWPRGGYMCIALPNAEGSFTVTLFLPNDGPHPSFATLPNANAALRFFERQFPDALALIPDFARDWDAHPVGQLATLYLEHWHLGGRALLLGDAAHAIVPFHGQGMNAGFEDAAELASLLDAQSDDVETTFAQFQRVRKPDADAIAAMALENYVEMRDGVADPHYLLKRELAFALGARAPAHFMPRYRMVTFTHLPYAYCLQRDRQQSALLESLIVGKTRIQEIDLDAAVARVRAQLPPLPSAVGAECSQTE